jgi:hypothetical protein
LQVAGCEPVEETGQGIVDFFDLRFSIYERLLKGKYMVRQPTRKS